MPSSPMCPLWPPPVPYLQSLPLAGPGLGLQDQAAAAHPSHLSGVYQGETYAASIEPRDSSGTAVNLASKTMYVVIENEDTAVDAVIINDADLTKTATTIGFTIDTVVTNVDNPSHLWALRDASTNEVYMHGTLYVDKGATQG